jgi:uncharacterized protein YbjT (DUF2867 family)
MGTKASIVGATGLVGRRILEELGDRLSARAWVRTPGSLPRGVVAHVSAEPPPAGDIFWSCDILFVALGTTMARAGSRAAFEKVDYGLVVECARKARDAGCTTLAMVSAAGADARSGLFYNAVKGRAEEVVLQMAFPRTVVARPSLLLGDRVERRWGELLARKVLGPIRTLFPKSVRPVRDREVARALVNAALNPSWAGARFLHNAELVRAV